MVTIVIVHCIKLRMTVYNIKWPDVEGEICVGLTIVLSMSSYFVFYYLNFLSELEIRML